jgi:peptide-methionine (S)-S-oxide reductase
MFMILGNIIKCIFGFIFLASSFGGCSKSKQNTANQNFNDDKFNSIMENNKKMTEAADQFSDSIEMITFGSGCFWCVEAVFQDLKGVIKVESGYSNGNIKNPTYKEVCSGLTGHAEVCQITYDSKIISFDELLEVFWKTHDPTTLNRQGADAGTQYRSGVFYHTEAQKVLAQAWKDKLNAEHVFPNPIVTEITPVAVFYKAEDYHQNYYKQNGYEPYCQIVIKPKMEKFEKAFKQKIKN